MVNNIKKSELVKRILNFVYKDGTTGNIARTVLTNMHQIEKLNSTALAELCCTTQSSISKFVAKLGLESYSDFQNQLANYRDKHMLLHSHKTNQVTNLLNTINCFSKNIAEFDFGKIVTEMKTAKKILIYSSGSSLRIGSEFYTALLKLGYFVNMPVDFSLKYATAISADSETLIICISRSGITTETIIPTIQAQNKGAKVIYINGSKFKQEIQADLSVNLLDYVQNPELNKLEPIDFSNCLNIFLSILLLHI
ncbi:MurR/RpiR family transcriptional regulator [Mycoplasma hafezii]|uniref:MurR/RpiR family transcriptional regulator n=1 Tax=Mycoplasma hafezii TaxID=525886 RepID=UPI003CE9A996